MIHFLNEGFVFLLFAIILIRVIVSLSICSTLR